MNIFSAIIDAMVSFVKNNPLTVAVIVMLAVFVPSFFGALLIGTVILIALLLAWPLYMFFKLRRMSRRMERESGNPTGGYYRRTRYEAGSQSEQREGDVKVYTSSAPQKKVNSDVGDYVDFEETKEPSQKEPSQKEPQEGK